MRSLKSLSDIFQQYNSVLESNPQWQQAVDNRQLSLYALHALCEKVSGKKVRVFSVETDIEFKKGMLLRGKNEIHVYMRQNLSREEKRFVQAKEFSHILVDTIDYYCTSPDNLLKVLSASSNEERENTFKNDTTNSKKALFSEQRAFFVALDLLYPIKFHKKDRNQLDKQETTYRRLAEALGIQHSLATRPFSKSYKRDHGIYIAENGEIKAMPDDWLLSNKNPH